MCMKLVNEDRINSMFIHFMGPSHKDQQKDEERRNEL